MQLIIWPPTPVSVSVPPLEFIYDGASTQVEQDTANAANNRGLPALVSYYKDGVQVPVLIDSVTPANNQPLPVEIANVSGTVNITAGDLNVSTVSTNDSMAIGDGVTGNLANVRQNGTTSLYELQVSDDDAIALLTTIDADTSTISSSIGTPGSAAASKGVQVLGTDGTNNRALLTDNAGVLQVAATSSALPTGAATLAEQQTQSTALSAIQTAVQLIDDVVNADGNPIGTKGIAIGGIDGSGNFQQASVNTAGELSVTFGSAGFATESTLAALSAKVANNYGSSSGAVRSAAQIGNTTGAADFNSGSTGAQTLRVAANLKREGNDLGYNSGAADANTLRTVLATRHETAATPLMVRLSDGTTAGGSGSWAGAQGQYPSVSFALPTISMALGWDGTTHREIAVDTSGNLKTSEVGNTITYQEITNLTTSAQTFTAPAGTKWMLIETDEGNSANIRVKIGGTATVSSGLQFQPGRSEMLKGTGNISVIAESGSSQKIYVQFG